ncbi:MAG TPA: hypothetical protein VH166_08615 [Mycobacterium sp.]|nr:hypothetical protein [Mycobacterium sp.]
MFSITAATGYAPVRATRRHVGVGWVVAVVLVVLVGCSADLPDRRPQADQLTQQIRAMPAVAAASNEVADSVAQGTVYFWLAVEVADDATGDQLAAITSRYLDGLRAVDYRGYQTELDVRHGANLFVVDGGARPVINADQVIDQARSWVALRHAFPGATIRLSASITHPTGPGQMRPVDVGHPNAGSIELPEDTDYTAVIAAVATVAEKFPQLGSGDWTISAGKAYFAGINTSRRLPTAEEIAVFNMLNADQVIPHVDVLTVNGPLTGPVWVSEKTLSRDPNVWVALAGQHLPIVAALPAPVLYTSDDQLQGHLDASGKAAGAVTVTVGGCTPRTYRPAPAEQALIDTYQKCHR